MISSREVILSFSPFCSSLISIRPSNVQKLKTDFSFLASISLETMDFLYFVKSSVTKILSLLFFNSFLALKTLFFAIHVLTYR